MMSQNRPPIEFVVDQTKGASRYQGSGNRFRNPSVRSYASSITWGSVDDDESEDWESEAFESLDGSYENDGRPGIPLRRATVSSSVDSAVHHHPLRPNRAGGEDVLIESGVDARPCIPSRQKSVGLELTKEEIMAELAAEAGLDSKPCMPTRQRSVGTELAMEQIRADIAAEALLDSKPLIPTRRKSAGRELALEEAMPADFKLNTTDAIPCIPTRQQSLASTSIAGDSKARLSFGTTGTESSTEPIPDCLLPEAREEFEAKLKDLKEKAEVFKRVVQLGDRKYALKTYKECFIGSEAVDRIIEAGLAADREEAVELGRDWMKFLGLFRHVCEDHDFKDKYLFYRFGESSKTKVNKTKSALPKIRRPWFSSTRPNPASPTIIEDQPMS